MQRAGKQEEQESAPNPPSSLHQQADVSRSGGSLICSQHPDSTWPRIRITSGLRLGMGIPNLLSGLCEKSGCWKTQLGERTLGQAGSTGKRKAPAVFLIHQKPCEELISCSPGTQGSPHGWQRQEAVKFRWAPGCCCREESSVKHYGKWGEMATQPRIEKL